MSVHVWPDWLRMNAPFAVAIFYVVFDFVAILRRLQERELMRLAEYQLTTLKLGAKGAVDEGEIRGMLPTHHRERAESRGVGAAGKLSRCVLLPKGFCSVFRQIRGFQVLRISKILSRVHSPGHRSLSRSRGKGRVGKKYQSFNGEKPEDECRVPGRALSRCHTYEGIK